MADTNPPPIFPAHIDGTIRSIAQFRAEHRENATPFQRSIDRMTGLLGHPWFFGVVTLIVLGWIGLNLFARPLGYRAIDPPPFAWLIGAVSIASLYMVILILATQRRDDQLAQHREVLTLELAILSEQKTAKVIQLLEELRRDSPQIRDRVDHEATAMSEPADPRSVLDAIKDSKAKAESIRSAPDGPNDAG